MKKTANAVIIGGGVIGLSIAYNLARLGLTQITLVEREYLTSGASGRCGAGVRMQWGTRTNCLLSRDSIRMLENLPEFLGVNGDIEFKQGGYLLLAYTEKMVNQFKQNLELQKSLDIDACWVDPQDAKKYVPYLNTDELLGATFCGKDGHCNPFKVASMYAEAASRLGVDIKTYTEVTGLKKDATGMFQVETTAGSIETPLVVNAAGGYAKNIGRMVGVELPIYPERHEILVTEPLDPLQGPMVMCFYHNLYCQQSPHGSFIMGIGHPDEPETHNIKSSWQFLPDMAQVVTKLLPPLAGLNVIRQWAGLYDMCPDRQPILGEDKSVKGFYTAAGFSGHGFMISPMTGQLVAEMILGQKTSMPIDVFAADRFERGDLFVEPSVV